MSTPLLWEPGGAYVYQNATLDLEDCEISGTVSPDGTPAVQAAGTGPDETATLRLVNCRFLNNTGPDLSIGGNVDCDIRGNKFEGRTDTPTTSDT